jgi:hypothetical protein
MRIKLFPLSFVITLLLTTVAVGGDMPGPGAAQKPPQSNAARAIPAICEPLNSRGGEVGSSAACKDATPDSTAGAIIFAIRLLLSVY